MLADGPVPAEATAELAASSARSAAACSPTGSSVLAVTECALAATC
jgi:hypothetical protein